MIPGVACCVDKRIQVARLLKNLGNQGPRLGSIGQIRLQHEDPFGLETIRLGLIPPIGTGHPGTRFMDCIDNGPADGSGGPCDENSFFCEGDVQMVKPKSLSICMS